MKDNLKADLTKIGEFLTLFNIEFMIYSDLTNNSLLRYMLPTSIYWSNEENKWNLSEREINFSVKEFNNIYRDIFEAEKEFTNKSGNKEKISAFMKEMDNL